MIIKIARGHPTPSYCNVVINILNLIRLAVIRLLLLIKIDLFTVKYTFYFVKIYLIILVEKLS